MNTISFGLKPDQLIVTTEPFVRPEFGETVAAPKAGAPPANATAAAAAATPVATFLAVLPRMQRFLSSLMSVVTPRDEEPRRVSGSRAFGGQAFGSVFEERWLRIHPADHGYCRPMKRPVTSQPMRGKGKWKQDLSGIRCRH